MGEAVATVNNLEITQNMVDAVLRRVPPEQVAQIKAQGQYNQFLERMAIGQVLYHQAVEQGLHKKPEVKLTLAMAARDALANEVISRVGEEAITEAKVQEYYETRKVQYARPSVHARHILVKELSLAEDLVKQLREGADFAALAKQYSTDPGSGSRGGDLGWFEKDKMIAAFSEVAFSSEIKQITDPVETRFGFHIIEVLEKRDTTPLDDVRAEIQTALEKEAIDKYMGELRTSMQFALTGEEKSAPEMEPEVTPPAEGH
jgi:peptidyl-prolyl cis-trans isomerase C